MALSVRRGVPAPKEMLLFPPRFRWVHGAGAGDPWWRTYVSEAGGWRHGARSRVACDGAVARQPLAH